MKKSFLIVAMFFAALLFTACDKDDSSSTSSDSDKISDTDNDAETLADSDLVSDLDDITDDELDGDTSDSEIIDDSEDADEPANDLDKEPVVFENASILSPTTISGDAVVIGTLEVKSALLINNCAKIRMEKDALIIVSDNGSIKTEGTADCPVVFTSNKTTPAKGDWKGIEIYNSSSAGNSFKHTVFEFAGYPFYGIIWVQGNAEVSIENSLFKEIEGNAIFFEEDVKIPNFSDNSFEGITGYPIVIYPENVKSLSKITIKNSVEKPAVKVVSGNIKTNAVWKYLMVPYECDSFDVEAPLKIEACVTLKMTANALIQVQNNGSLSAEGGDECIVTFTSAKPNPAKGDWSRIDFYNTSSSNNSLNYAVIEYADGGSYGSLWIDNNSSISIRNTVFRNILKNAIIFEDEVQINEFSGNSFDNLGGYPIVTYPENIRFFDTMTVKNSPNNFVFITSGDVKTPALWKNTGVNFKAETFGILAPLEVAAGIDFYMMPQSIISVKGENGLLKLSGTADKKIKITSAKTSPAAGDWEYIEIYATSGEANVFKYTEISYGGGASGAYGQLWLEENATLNLENVIFSNGKKCDIYEEANADLNAVSSTYQLCPQ